MTSKIDPKLLDKNVTLKSTVKRKRKNKKTNLQELYDAGLVRSEAFYKELITFIKWRLMPDLIKKGYYINGIRQSNFTMDECNACYTEVLEKILTDYNPEEGTLATFVRWKIRGWGTKVTQKQYKEYRWMPTGILSLDSIPQNTVKVEDFKLKSDLSAEILETLMDVSKYGIRLIDSITRDDMTIVQKGIEDIDVKGEWDSICQ